ncbi:MAG: hypothetical protein HY664_01960 [Chloroflexi bacterium]|nr:hypothetical protein [Chloroflexota bacterium]
MITGCLFRQVTVEFSALLRTLEATTKLTPSWLVVASFMVSTPSDETKYVDCGRG